MRAQCDVLAPAILRRVVDGGEALAALVRDDGRQRDARHIAELLLFRHAASRGRVVVGEPLLARAAPWPPVAG